MSNGKVQAIVRRNHQESRTHVQTNWRVDLLIYELQSATRRAKNFIVDRLRLFMAPLLLGGDGRDWTGGLRVPRVRSAPSLRESGLRKLGRDWLVEGEF